jgi:CHAT domain-containing protein
MPEPIGMPFQSSSPFLPHIEELLQRAQGGESITALADDWPSPFNTMAIESVRRRAEAYLDISPRSAYAIASLAYVLAQRLHQLYPRGHKTRALRGRCATTLAAAERRRANYPMAAHLLSESVNLLKGRRNAAARRRALLEQASLLRDLDRYEDAEITYRALLTEAQQTREAQYELACCYRGLGQVLRARNRYSEAAEHAQMAADLFAYLGDSLAAARCRLDLAFDLFLQDPERALNHVQVARSTFEAAQSRGDLAEADFYAGLICSERGHFAEALPLFEAARRVFLEEGVTMRAALTDINHANTLSRMGRMEEALSLLQQARQQMVAADRTVMVVACDVNIGIIQAALGRYQQALTVYEQALALCQSRGFQVDAARCLVNMATVYGQTGQYARALDYYQQAREIFKAAGFPSYRALCDQNLGTLYYTIGEAENAIVHYGAARETFADQGMPGFTARCDTQLAAVYLDLEQWDEAQRRLEQARAICYQEGMTLGVDLCEMLIAEVERRRGDKAAATQRYTAVRERLRQAGMAVDAAVCTIALGELALEAGDPARAQSEFEVALPAVAAGFPEHAWRAAFGLGRAHEQRGNLSRALAFYREAAEFVRQARATLWTEEVSSRFFNQRRFPFVAGIHLAFELQDHAAAIELVEKSKGQTILSLLRVYEASLHLDPKADLRTRTLLEQEERLRQQIAQLRSKVALSSVEGMRSASMPDHFSERELAAELAHLEHQHAAAIAALRAHEMGLLSEDQYPVFNLGHFRAIAAQHLAQGWAALAYYQQDDELLTFYIDAGNLHGWRRRLRRYDILALSQATDPDERQRRLFYAPPPGGQTPEAQTLLRHLRQLLIPVEIEERMASGIPWWIIVPHNRLHFLPFHALWGGGAEGYLGQKATLIYTPLLQVLQTLLVRRSPSPLAKPRRALILGVSEFGGQAPPLPHVLAEANAVSGALPDAVVRLDGEASLVTLRALQASGELATFDVIHVASHAVFDPQSPLNSRILLSDGDLSVAEIFHLNLKACRVILSTCQSGVSRLHPGDEMVGLLQAFFCAGVSGILASLWPVSDVSTVGLMERFYRGWTAGMSPALALQQAQKEMDTAGFPLFHWAGFQWFGIP